MSEQAPRLRVVDEFWRQLAAIDPVRAHRVRRSARRRRAARTLALAALMLIALAAVALAARALLLGDPAPPAFPLERGSAARVGDAGTLLSPRVSDPDDGPPWAMRTFEPRRRGTVCLQVGRLVDGRLVGLGINGAFGDDRRAHLLPLESDVCGGLSPHPRLVAAPDVRDSSATISEPRCLDPRGRAERERSIAALAAYVERLRGSGPAAELARALRALDAARARALSAGPPCDPAALRTVLAGFVGPAGGAVTLTEPGGRRHVVVTRAQETGAFLFVLSGQLDGPALQLSVRYPDGRVCAVGNPLQTEPVEEPPPAEQAACLRAAGYTR